MKKLIAFLFVISAIGSCTKKEVDPKVLAEAVVGTYDISSLSIKSTGSPIILPKLPFTQDGVTYTATAELISTFTDEIDIRMLTLADGIAGDPTDFEGFELRKREDNYGLYLSNQLVADLDGRTINFDLTTTDSSGETVYFRFNGRR